MQQHSYEPRPPAGFTIIEVLVALVLLGLVSAALYRVLVNNQRSTWPRRQRIDLSQNIRAASTILPAEFRELDARKATSPRCRLRASHARDALARVCLQFTGVGRRAERRFGRRPRRGARSAPVFRRAGIDNSKDSLLDLLRTAT